MKRKDIIIGSSIGGIFASLLATIIYYNTRQSIPERAYAVRNFKPKKYLGRWFEIARLDYYFEKDLNNVTADYSLNNDGTIKVINRGYNFKEYKEVESTGKAKFVHSSREAMLKVSFFGPFYAGYNVIAIDKRYRYALVAGRNLNYLWILSRDITIPYEILDSYLKIAKNIGYDTDKLIWTDHNHFIK